VKGAGSTGSTAEVIALSTRAPLLTLAGQLEMTCGREEPGEVPLSNVDGHGT
jgi:hypothetical protein